MANIKHPIKKFLFSSLFLFVNALICYKTVIDVSDIFIETKSDNKTWPLNLFIAISKERNLVSFVG